MAGLFKPMSEHYHLIGIGGVGMGAIASLLLDKGFKVSGSDLKESQITENLKKKGAQVFVGHSAENVRGADAVVYSSAVSQDNPELAFARQNQIRILKRAQVLAWLMESQIGITVAGAHGKTTTTSMVSHLLITAGLCPTTAVGGIINGGSYHASLGRGEYFVAEVDESDGSFLYFSPHYSIITNIDFEHVDYYQNWENILKAYGEFIEKTNPKGCLIACGEDQKLLKLLSEKKRRFVGYGLSPASHLYAKNISCDGYFLTFDCIVHEKNMGEMRLRIPGRHNVLNALACTALGLELKIGFDVIRKSLNEFSGAQRRFQFKGEVAGVMVVDDYGHHPTEIKATLQAARSFGRRVVVAFQPHRYSRTKFLMKEFAQSLQSCDYLILTDIYAASEEPIEGITSEALYQLIKKNADMPVVYLKKEDITDHLLGLAKAGDLVLTLGAGDINKISDTLIRKLNDLYVKST